ncbi:MAG: T9SS type A sorting domain-containing protein [Bacteroidales bacterium]|nr:T9SS type A sorting domain-containing protein [Bacteroidales bacterium]
MEHDTNSLLKVFIGRGLDGSTGRFIDPDSIYCSENRTKPILNNRLVVFSNLYYCETEADAARYHYYEFDSLYYYYRCIGDTIRDTFDMYEYYFDEPFMAIDTFMFGVYYYPHEDSIHIHGVGTPYVIFYIENEEPMAGDYFCKTPPGYSGNYLKSLILFPILAPYTPAAPDTTGTGGGDDTVGISAVTGQVAIDIAPNPTDNVTTVSSAVPLRMVEAYDVAGRLLLHQPATGRTTKIDMSGYRPGCYILKIHTSAGTAHRKLILR